ncbi:Acyl-CoA desaturase [Nymphon striatum]|nr:Acyl-CoA desaturase [Nymphon striatum]
MAIPKSEAQPVGLLTCLPRDQWADMFNVLQQDPENRKSLENIQKSILFMAIDSSATDDEFSPDPLIRLMEYGLHAGGSKNNGGNRWFDKQQYVVHSKQGFGTIMEHSILDGYPSMWVLFTAEKEMLTEQNDLSYTEIIDFGGARIQAKGFSPDSFLQMAQMLAYYSNVNNNVARLRISSEYQYIVGNTKNSSPGRAFNREIAGSHSPSFSTFRGSKDRNDSVLDLVPMSKTCIKCEIELLKINEIKMQNPIYEWTRDHRVHHKYSDTDADPHNTKRGFFFAHMGWLMMKKHPEVSKKGKGIDLSDLYEDAFRGMKMSGQLIVAGAWKHLVILHTTWSVNSVAHFWGNKPYDETIRPTENLFVALVANGEGYHNYHHTFPFDYSTSEYRFGVNLTTLFIDTMAYVGLVYDRKKIKKESVNSRRVRTGNLRND